MTRELSQTPGAVRQRRLRARRKNGWIRVVPIEIGAVDSVALKCAGYLRQDESARTDLPKALRRLLDSVRNALPDAYKS